MHVLRFFSQVIFACVIIYGIVQDITGAIWVGVIGLWVFFAFGVFQKYRGVKITGGLDGSDGGGGFDGGGSFDCGGGGGGD